MRIIRWDGEVAREVADEVAEEEPLEIRVGNRPISVTMRTPGHDADLAIGFLVTEGIIERREDLLAVRQCVHNREGNVLNVLLAGSVRVDFARLTRHVFASSSCGICGKASIESIHGRFPPVDSTLIVGVGVIATLPALMRAAQTTFDRTGGLHAAALFDRDGGLIVLREDVGRHNAVDKVVGFALRTGLFPLDRHILVVSGRSSFEILQKALAARIPDHRRRLRPLQPRRRVRPLQRPDPHRLPPRRPDEPLRPPRPNRLRAGLKTALAAKRESGLGRLGLDPRSTLMRRNLAIRRVVADQGSSSCWALWWTKRMETLSSSTVKRIRKISRRRPWSSSQISMGNLSLSEATGHRMG